jgi:membrane peptidoglycan carboxypeptidase
MAGCGPAYPWSVQTPRFARKVGVVAQIAGLAVATGALVAAIAIPAVGLAGMAVRSTATNFNDMATPELGQVPVRSEILDRHGNVLAYYYGRGIDRVPVSYAQISPVMRQAVVAIEDSRFYQHGAIDFKGTLRALIYNMEHKTVQGGSTLAQQYVKNVLYLSSPNPQAAFAGATSETIGRKIRELRMAVRVEHSMTKNQILAGYLNAAYFGSSAYGVQVAAQRYFSTDASQLTLAQAALLAGLVENPSLYDPLTNQTQALQRRNVVLQRMVTVGDITQAQADAAGRQPIGLNPSIQQIGCTSSTALYAGYFCDYALAAMREDPAYKQAWQRLNGIGGLKIYTTLDPADQRAARAAVDYQMPRPPSAVNPGNNADTEVLIQPGTGDVRAIAIDRPYGFGPHQNSIDYAVGPQYNGSYGVQIGSTGKVYTMVTALLQGVPFGYTKNVGFSATVAGYTNCKGQPTAPWQVHNDESEAGGHYSLYTGTTASINVFFAYLEQKVGLCNVVRTAAKMGLTWPDGRSLLKPDPREHHSLSADNDPSFTLGADNVAPIDVAASDAVLPARGIYCHPIAIRKIVTMSGASLPVESANCHRVLPTTIADAANYILQGDLTGLGTAARDAVPFPAASKTGTADQYVSAFFVGYTPGLLGAVWTGNPAGGYAFPMAGYPGSCYVAGCVGAMYGSFAPGATWQQTFLNIPLPNPPLNFVPVPPTDPLWSMGTGIVSANPPKPKPSPSPHGGGGGNGGGGNGGGNGNGNGNGNGGGNGNGNGGGG